MADYSYCEYSNNGNDQLVNRLNHTSLSIYNNDPIESSLNVVCVHINPSHFQTRTRLTKNFIEVMNRTPNVTLYIGELVYGDDAYEVTDKNNTKHLQLRTSRDNLLWHKESLLNLVIQKCLPENWKAVAWVDADLFFDNGVDWAMHTLKILNGYKDVVQLFNMALDLDKDGNTMNAYHSFCYNIANRNKMYRSSPSFSHTGYGWSCTRKFYDTCMKGLLDICILGSGDYVMALSFINKDTTYYSENYKKLIDEFKERCKYCRIGYIPVLISHFYHGSKSSRGYDTRWKYLQKYKYDPITMISRDRNGLIIPNKNFPKGLRNYMTKYFNDRQEDR